YRPAAVPTANAEDEDEDKDKDKLNRPAPTATAVLSTPTCRGPSHPRGSHNKKRSSI
ncbi:hypothetical protein ACHAQD_012531, partial [Fusarium lateritium]